MSTYRGLIMKNIKETFDEKIAEIKELAEAAIERANKEKKEMPERYRKALNSYGTLSRGNVNPSRIERAEKKATAKVSADINNLKILIETLDILINNGKSVPVESKIKSLLQAVKDCHNALQGESKFDRFFRKLFDCIGDMFKSIFKLQPGLEKELLTEYREFQDAVRPYASQNNRLFRGPKNDKNHEHDVNITQTHKQ